MLEKYYLKIPLYFLVDNAKHFTLYVNYYSTVNNETEACIFVNIING